MPLRPPSHMHAGSSTIVVEQVALAHANALFGLFLRVPLTAHVLLHLCCALIAIVLLPSVETLRNMAFAKRVGVLFALMFVLIHLAAAAPSPSNIEGLVYMQAEITGLGALLLTQPEMIFQSLLLALGFSWAIKKPSAK